MICMISEIYQLALIIAVKLMCVQLTVLALEGNEEITQIKLILYNDIVIATSLNLSQVSTIRYV